MKRSKLPKSLTTVTPFSKFLALSMLVVFPILAFFLGVYYERIQSAAAFRTYYKQTRENVRSSQERGCTMDAKMCPDGSYVGRTSPNCEFAACPEEK